MAPVHEVELAARVLNALRQVVAERGGRVVGVNLQVGEINEPGSLRLWLRKLGGDEFGSTKFKISSIPITVRCRCGYAGAAKSLDTHSPDPRLGVACPKCGGHDLAITTGQELEIIDVKLEKGVSKCRAKKSR